MGDTLDKIEKGGTVALSVGWKIWLWWRKRKADIAAAKAKLAEARAVAALVKLNAANAKAAAHIEMKLKQSELLEEKRREEWK